MVNIGIIGGSFVGSAIKYWKLMKTKLQFMI